MPSIVQLDACVRRRSPATLSSFHQGRAPRNKGQRYPADPPTVEEIIAVMHAAGDDHDAVRLRGLIIVLWCAGLRISEALALNESDLDLHRGAILVRRGKGGKRREVGMDRGPGSSWAHGCSCAPRCRSALCSVCCAVRLPVARGHRRVSDLSCTTLPPGRVCDAGSRLISSDTPTRWRCRAKACRCSSFNANSGTLTSRSRRSICVGSITPRSSTPSTNAQHR
jgi:Phage integrase family